MLQDFIGAVSLGLIWAVMAIAIYITYKILDIADCADRSNAQVLASLDDGLDDAAFGIQIDLRLIVIADMDIRPKLDASLIRHNFTQKNAEERRLARAVIPDQKGALPFF